MHLLVADSLDLTADAFCAAAPAPVLRVDLDRPSEYRWQLSGPDRFIESADGSHWDLASQGNLVWRGPSAGQWAANDEEADLAQACRSLLSAARDMDGRRVPVDPDHWQALLPEHWRKAVRRSLPEDAPGSTPWTVVHVAGENFAYRLKRLRTPEIDLRLAGERLPGVWEAQTLEAPLARRLTELMDDWGLNFARMHFQGQAGSAVGAALVGLDMGGQWIWLEHCQRSGLLQAAAEFFFPVPERGA